MCCWMQKTQESSHCWCEKSCCTVRCWPPVCVNVFASSVCIQPFNSETELIGGLLYLVLGFTVQHVCGRDSLDGQDDITGTQVCCRGLTARSNLKERGMFKSLCEEMQSQGGQNKSCHGAENKTNVEHAVFTSIKNCKWESIFVVSYIFHLVYV